MRRLLGRDARIWVIGSANDRYWANLDMTNRTLIPYGVPNPPVGDVAAARELRADLVASASFVYLYVGRLSPEKAPLDVVAAFERVNDVLDGVRLLLVGDGPLRDAVEQRAAQNPNVLPIGPWDNRRLGDFYLAADVLVVPSHQESWGLVVNEAVANGLPVIASHRVASADELVDPDRGWRYHAGDIEGLAKAMTTAADRGRRRNSPRIDQNVANLMAADLATLTAKQESTPLSTELAGGFVTRKNRRSPTVAKQPPSDPVYATRHAATLDGETTKDASCAE